jgi:hypothetical protein
MVLRMMRAGHKCVVYDVHPEATQARATGATCSRTSSASRSRAPSG